MTQTANNYGTVLFELGIKKETVEETKKIFKMTSELPHVLSCPVVSRKEKHRVIETFFPQEIQNFLKELCDHGHVDAIDNVFRAYQNCYDEKNGILRAEMSCAEMPDEMQLTQIKNYLAEKYKKTQVELEFRKQPELIAGFVLCVGDIEEDFSIRGRLDRLQQKLTWR